MKLVLINMFVFLASLNTFAKTSPGAFDKLRTMFETASALTSVAAVYTEISKIKGCANSSQDWPDSINNSYAPFIITYTTPDFGPAFPSEIIKGIAFKSESNDFSNVTDEFFNGYSENLTSNSLELKSHEFYNERECEDDLDGKTRCHTYTRTIPVILKIRLTPKYLVYEREGEYVYCWK